MVADFFLVCSDALRETRNNSCSRCATFFALFSVPAKTCFNWLDFSLESACFQLTDMICRFPQSLGDASYRLALQSRSVGQTTPRLMLKERGSVVELPTRNLASLLTLVLVPLGILAYRPTSVDRTARTYFLPPDRIAVVTHLAGTCHTLLHMQLFPDYIIT